MIIYKQRQEEQRGYNMEELQTPELTILGVGKSEFFNQLKLKIQDHGVVALLYTSPTSQITP
jgi:hypothetical protein